MQPVHTVTLEGDAIATVRHQADLIDQANQKRGIGWFFLSRLRMGAAGEWAFAQWLAKYSKLSFAGPLPYCGTAEHSPEDFIIFRDSDRLTIDLHSRHPDQPVTYPAWHWKRNSFPDRLIVAQLEIEPASVAWDAGDWEPSAIRATFTIIRGERLRDAKVHQPPQFEKIQSREAERLREAGKIPSIHDPDHFLDTEGIWHLCIHKPQESTNRYCRLPDALLSPSDLEWLRADDAQTPTCRKT